MYPRVYTYIMSSVLYGVVFRLGTYRLMHFYVLEKVDRTPPHYPHPQQPPPSIPSQKTRRYSTGKNRTFIIYTPFRRLYLGEVFAGGVRGVLSALAVMD